MVESVLQLLSLSKSSNDLKAIEKNKKKILCLGHSYTYGMGAPKGESYPDHLQNILKNNGYSTYQVLNFGIPGMNSNELLLNLSKYLNKTNPSIVILRIGDMDLSNFNHIETYLINKKTKGLKKIKLKFQQILYLSKIYQFFVFRNRKANYQRPIHKKCSCSKKEQSDLDSWLRIVNFTPKGEISYPKEINNKQTVERAHFCIDELMNCSTFKSDIATAHLYKGTLLYLLKDYDSSLESYIKGVQVNPCADKVGDVNFSYSTIRNIFINRGLINTKKRELLLANARNFLSKNDPSNFFRLFPVTPEEIQKWTKHNLIKIIKALVKRNIKIVLQEYAPHPYYPELKNFGTSNKILNEFAIKHKIPIVKNHSLFLKLWEKGEDRNNYYWIIGNELDDHMNSNGYKQMAKHIFSLLTKNMLIYKEK